MFFAVMRKRDVQGGAIVVHLALLLGFCFVMGFPHSRLMAEEQALLPAPASPPGMQWLHADLPLHNLARPEAVASSSATTFDADGAIAVPAQQIRAGAAGHLTINLELPNGYHLNPRAPLTYIAKVSGAGLHIAESVRRFRAIAPSLPLSVAFQAAPGEHQATIDIEMTFYYCREDDTGVCAMQSVRWLVPLHTTTSGETVQPVLSYKAEAPVINKHL